MNILVIELLVDYHIFVHIYNSVPLDSFVQDPPTLTKFTPVMGSVMAGQCDPLTTQLFGKFFAAPAIPPPPSVHRLCVTCWGGGGGGPSGRCISGTVSGLN